MDIINHEEEFRPIDDDRAAFIAELATDLQVLQHEGDITETQRDMLGIASNNMLILLSMAMAGYDLFRIYKQLANDLYRDANITTGIIESMSPATLPLLPTEAINSYDKVHEMFDEDEIPFT